ncbi:MAG: histidine--tRNA ligase [Thermoplasmatota archaeon]
MYQVPRGTRDFTPKEMKIRRYIEEEMIKTFTTYGYCEVQTPIFENLELFTAKSGDSIIDEIYDFSDKSGRKLALRPELTAPVIRFYVEKLQMEPKPLKLYYFGNCFRYDRPQKGRYREFKQAGCELIGVNTPEAHAELIALAYNLLKNIGLKNITLNIGNLTIIDSIFNILNLSQEDKKDLLPLIDKSRYEEIYETLSNKAINNETINNIIEILQKSDIKKLEEVICNDQTAMDELQRLKQLIHLLQKCFHLKQLKLDMSIVRGLDYYKGIVFEIEAPALGAEKQLCGGGVYDLVGLFGGRDTPTAGFAIGIDRTILALEAEKFQFPTVTTDVCIIPYSNEMIEKSIEIAQQLRQHSIITEIDLLNRGIGKALKHANSKHCKTVLIIGPNELEKDSVALRNMLTGEQQLIKINQLIPTLQKTN